ncbi:hypothetical protein JCM6882_001049 [Rhodosporidiobolus microsporus]
MSARVAPAATTTTTASSSRRGYNNASSGSNRYPGQGYRRGEPVQYTVERVLRDGVEQEVLTLEDTPEPSAAAAAAGSSNGNAYASTSAARQDPYGGYEPAPKKRKSDVGAGAYAAPQYAAAPAYTTHNGGASGSSSYQQYRAPVAATTSGTKRKADDYDRDNRPQQKAKEQPSGHSDTDGHFIVKLGAVIRNQMSPHSYRVEKLLGQGTFGKVVSAIEEPGNRKVALKIIRNVHKYQEAAKTEIKVLQTLRGGDPMGKFKCIRLDTSFDFFGHTCLVTPLLSCSVFDFLKENSYQPFPLLHVQKFAHQLLTSLDYVHDSHFIHTDLKPENILLERSEYDERVIRGKTRKILRNPGIVLIDFGSATADKDYHATVVSTRHYRAPEIILNSGWSFPCDMWSIGCILVEFISGEALFQTHENLEHLAMMDRVFGSMPQDMIRTALATLPPENKQWFKRATPQPGRRSSKEYALNFPLPNTPHSSRKYVKGMKNLRDYIATYAGNDVAADRFHDLCAGLLQWDVKKRLTVKQALRHPFFDLKIAMDEGVPAPPRR